jgi:hypothetical protein
MLTMRAASARFSSGPEVRRRITGIIIRYDAAAW